MNKYQNEQYGQRATPEFEEALCFFIQMDTGFLRTEDCSEFKQSNTSRQDWNIEILVTASRPFAADWRDLR
jgi:hypothetical protein